MSYWLIFALSAVFITTGFIFISYIASCYNDLVSVKNNISKSWANIDVLLKQRHDELTKLIDLCKQHMEYESKTFVGIIKARKGIETAYQQNDMQAFVENEKNLQNNVKNLFALAENYSVLQTNQIFRQIAEAIHTLETRIAERRELFNESVNLNNTLIEQFPTNILSNLFQFKHFELSKISSAETSDINLIHSFKI